MITSVEINNFKSLVDISVPFKGLNVITGINGMGKSSLIQSLLLLRQAYVPNGIGRGVALKGELTGNLGTFADVLFRNALEDIISFKINTENDSFIWRFEKKAIDDILQGDFPLNIDLQLPLFSDNKFQYIAAGRITPTSFFQKSGESLAFKQFGSTGEYAVQYLFEKGTDEMALFADELDKHSGKALPLINQVDYWLKTITPNVSLDIRLKSSNEYELRYKYLNEDKGFVSYSAVNSAFGLTISLPIITALLAAKPGDLVILENPESDLHPRAQSVIGKLIAKAVSEGIQVIVETHSDHILNGICVAINKNVLLNSDVKFYYFHKDHNSSKSKVKEVIVKENGRIDDKNLRELGITGFFDQANIDLDTILFSK